MFHVKLVSVWHLRIRSVDVFSSQEMRATLIHLRQVRVGHEMHSSIVHIISGQGMNAGMNDTHNLGGCTFTFNHLFHHDH